MKYKKPTKKQKHKTTTEDEDVNENAVETDDTAIDDIGELSYLLYFKTCIVDRELDILKIKLTKTIEMRESLIKKRVLSFIRLFLFISSSRVWLVFVTLLPNFQDYFLLEICLSLNRYFSILKFHKFLRIQTHYLINGIPRREIFSSVSMHRNETIYCSVSAKILAIFLLSWNCWYQIGLIWTKLSGNSSFTQM